MVASEAALRAVEAVVTVVEVPSAAWIEAEAQHVISAAGAVPAGRACHRAAVDHVVAADSAAEAVADPVAVAAAVVAAEAAEAGGKHENIPYINSNSCKGEENDASRKPQ
jgi:hypothetical protein